MFADSAPGEALSMAIAEAEIIVFSATFAELGAHYCREDKV